MLKLKKEGKYIEKCKIPQYLPKKGYFVSIFPQDMFRVNKKGLRLSLEKYFTNIIGQRYLYFKISRKYRTINFNQIRIIPKYNAKYLEIEYLYEIVEDKPILDYSRYMGIDLGLQNFGSCYSGVSNSFIIEGSGIVSYNSWYNKNKSKLQSKYDHLNVKFGDKMAICSIIEK